MTEDIIDWLDFGEFSPEAVRRLVIAHQAEYLRHASAVEHEDEIRALKAQIAKLERTVKELRELNPDGVFVPALQKTVEILGETKRSKGKRTLKSADAEDRSVRGRTL